MKGKADVKPNFTHEDENTIGNSEDKLNDVDIQSQISVNSPPKEAEPEKQQSSPPKEASVASMPVNS